MSKGKKFVALSLMTFIVLIVLGAMWGHHSPGDTTGPGATLLNNYPKTTTNVPVSQAGINQLASDSGHLGVSINFTWTLITGFLVLFMQVGFAFLVTGLTRAKNAAHMMMMNIAAFAVALLAYYAVGFAFQFGGIAPIANLGGVTPLSGIFGHGSAGHHRPARVLPAERRLLRRRRDGAVPVRGRVHGDRRLHHHRRDRRADLVRRVPPRRDHAGRDHLPDLRHVAVGRRLVGAPRHVDAPRSRRGRLRRIGSRARNRRLDRPRARDGARAPHREVQQGRLGQRDTRVTTSRTS